MTVAEVVVLPSRDHVRFNLMNGGMIECPIADVSLVKSDKGKITLMTKREGGKNFRVVIDSNSKIMRREYINPELIIAIGHPDVQKL